MPRLISTRRSYQFRWQSCLVEFLSFYEGTVLIPTGSVALQKRAVQFSHFPLKQRFATPIPRHHGEYDCLLVSLGEGAFPHRIVVGSILVQCIFVRVRVRGWHVRSAVRLARS